MFARPNCQHSQIAYVTSDMDEALRQFDQEYGVSAFHVFENNAPELEQSDTAKLKIALAIVGGAEIELIEPLGSSAPLFSQYLPDDGSFAIRFHHLAFRINGSLADFEAHIASIDPGRHPIIWQGNLGDMMRYAYTDERETLGHFVEHIWMHEDIYSQMRSAIPSFPA